jgi:hypothetical protein
MPGNLVIVLPSRNGLVELDEGSRALSPSRGPSQMNRIDSNLLVLAAAGGELSSQKGNALSQHWGMT